MDLLIQFTIKLFMSTVRENLRKLVPFALVYSWVELIQSLCLSPYSFIAETSNASVYSEKWLIRISDQVTELSKILMIIMVAYFLSNMVLSLIPEEGKDTSKLPWVLFLMTWILYTASNNFNNYYAQIPFWLLLGLIAFVLAFIARKLKMLSFNQRAVVFVISIFSTYSLSKYLARHMSSSPDLLLQMASLSLLGPGPNHVLSVVFWSSIAVIMQGLGLLVPYILQTPANDLILTSENVNAALSGHLDNIPHLFSLYTLRDSFAMFGGLGMVLPLLLAVLIESKKLNKPYHFHLSILCFLPVLFDQPLAFLVGLPIILEPLILLPMLAVTILSEVIGAIVLTLKWVHPAVFIVPEGTPNLIFAFLASNGDWRYFIIVTFIITVSILIYLPFIKRAFQREALYD
ncbi:PTS sugar transporter subunit IIC [Streptococcus porcinus]|uniref:PTS sugar transporter subunit IIC n=1 Tax=Streptococcus porcinus TaxID=1340 RepID=A0A7W0AR60_STRPO|nr:PTS sugar transporter subunit IIC [Streptococcus porcinus]MBA2795901.1 PTS sugar transporter subunit IIC [Streptococcus porcinus]